jgi:hypothetical protein
VPIIAAVPLVGAGRQKHQGSHLSLAPIFAAALLLPPALTALAIVIAFVPETVRSRPRWYIAVFNVANFVGPALFARACFDAVGGAGNTAWALAASAGIAASSSPSTPCCRSCSGSRAAFGCWTPSGWTA